MSIGGVCAVAVGVMDARVEKASSSIRASVVRSVVKFFLLVLFIIFTFFSLLIGYSPHTWGLVIRFSKWCAYPQN